MAYPEFVKYERIPHLWEIPELLDRDVEVYEKLDGGNAQIRKYKERVLAGNRSKFLTDRNKRFPWFQVFLKWALGNYCFYNLSENEIIFGEWLSKHTLDYFPEKMNRFYFIDLFDMNSQRFMPYQSAVRRLEELEIEEVEFLSLLFKGRTNMNHLEQLVRRSDYREGRAEGLVIKDYNSQRFAKLWASSLDRKKRTLSDKDVNRVVMSMIESGVKITPEKIVEEIFTDFSRQRILQTRSAVEKAVNNYLSFM